MVAVLEMAVIFPHYMYMLKNLGMSSQLSFYVTTNDVLVVRYQPSLQKL